MQNKAECSMVKDLLPLSEDGLLSEKSEAFLQEHLKTCKKCREYRELLIEQNLENENEQQKKEKKFVRVLKKRRYEILGLIFGIVLVFAVFIGGISYSFRAVNSQVKQNLTQASDYGKEDFRGLSKLSLFPNAKQMSGDILEYYYDCDGSTLYQNYQIYLKCKYTVEAFQKEKDRIMKLTDEATGKGSVYSEEENELPCIYTMLYDEAFEYALLSEETGEIYYIYLQGIDRDDLQFDTELLPKDYGQRALYFETEREPYRMYEKLW